MGTASVPNDENEYYTLRQKLEAYETGVMLLGDEAYYIGFCPLEASHSELVCIVPVSVLNRSLLAYQRIAVEMIVVGMLYYKKYLSYCTVVPKIKCMGKTVKK